VLKEDERLCIYGFMALYKCFIIIIIIIIIMSNETRRKNVVIELKHDRQSRCLFRFVDPALELN